MLCKKIELCLANKQFFTKKCFLPCLIIIIIITFIRRWKVATRYIIIYHLSYLIVDSYLMNEKLSLISKNYLSDLQHFIILMDHFMKKNI